MTAFAELLGLAVGGALVAGESGTYPVHDPGRPNEVVLEAPWSSTAQVDRAVTAAAGAALGWAEVPFAERAELVAAAATAGAEAAAAADLAVLLTREHGKVLSESQLELALPAAIAATFVELAAGALPARAVGSGTLVARPHGVVAALLPFNWPVSVLVSKIAPALLAGNTVVVKPPPTCPGTTLAVAGVMAAALPAGVLNTVNGPGAEVGESLVTHPAVAMITLTGGVATGRAVMRSAAERLVPVLLELGGNDAAIVAPDITPDHRLAQELLDAALPTSGQVCLALKRLYVPEGRVDEFVAALVDRASRCVTGHGLDPEVTIGPVHTAAAAQRAEAMVAEAEAAGARVYRPGRVTAEAAGSAGYYVSPAVVSRPPRTATVVTEEQFAPLLPVIGYRDLDDAVAAANDSSFALGASVWSGDADLAAGLATRLEAGTVFTNAHGPGALDPHLPLGGWKTSGIGCEFGSDGILAYTRRQARQPPRLLPSNPESF